MDEHINLYQLAEVPEEEIVPTCGTHLYCGCSPFGRFYGRRRAAKKRMKNYPRFEQVTGQTTEPPRLADLRRLVVEQEPSAAATASWG